MSSTVDIDEETQKFVREILSRNNFTSNSIIEYFRGSEAGDGYGSKTIAVDVKEDERTLHLFLKCALTEFQDEDFLKIYVNEVFLYKTVIPTYYEFLEEKGIKDGFRNAPKCYGVYEKAGSEIVALDNLRKKNFTLFDKHQYMDDKHLSLILRTYAKFHAISFAIKDQRRALHDEFCANRPNIFILLRIIGFEKIMCSCANDFFAELDPEEDDDILKKRDGMNSKIVDQVVNMNKYLSEYVIFTKGDCWVNNTMILYEDETPENPIDVMLIDWQGVTGASPVHDIQPFFYSVSSERTLENYQYYLKLYHDELCTRIRELGSDPETLYPFSVFEQEWKSFGPYCFGLSLFTVKMLLCKQENAPVIDKVAGNAEATQRAFENVSDDMQQFLERGKYIFRHLIKVGAL